MKAIEIMREMAMEDSDFNSNMEIEMEMNEEVCDFFLSKLVLVM